MPHRCNCIFNIDQTKKDHYRAVCDGLCRGLFINADEAVDIFTYEASDPLPVGRIPALGVTSDGTLLAAFERRESADDASARKIVQRRSTDGGQTWSEETEIVPATIDDIREGQTVHNPVYVTLPDGEVLLLFGVDYRELHLLRSKDHGASYAAPTDLTPMLREALDARPQAGGYAGFAAAPGHGVVMTNGDIRVPLWITYDRATHRPSVLTVIGSSDGGATWTVGDLITGTEDWTNPSEAVAAELGDGRIMLNMRHEGGDGYRLVTYSADGLTGWETPQYDRELPDPVCHAALTSHPTEHWLGFVNCASEPDASGGDDRKRLTLRFSIDEGETWPRVIQVALYGGYAAAVWAPDGRSVYLLFEQGRVPNAGRLNSSIKFVNIHIDMEEAMETL